MAEDSVILDMKGLRQAQGLVQRAMSSAGTDTSNPLSRMFVRWGVRYAAFSRRRFIRLSRGGGEWPPLADSTKASRRGPGSRHSRRTRIVADAKRRGITLTPAQLRLRLLASARTQKTRIAKATKAGKPPKPRAFSILVDTGGLRDALEPTAYGNLLSSVPGGVLVGFAAVPHKGRSKKQLSMGELASIHHFGKGHNPTRTILVAPDADTQQGMLNDAKKAADEIGRMIGGGNG